MKPLRLSLLAALVVLNLQAAGGKVLWEENFSKDGPPEENGYTVLRSNGKDVFEIKNGVLNIVCFNSPYKGTYFRKSAPIVPKGEFSFEIRTCTNGKLNSDNSSLKFHYGQHIFAFRFPHWEIYSPDKRKWHAGGKIGDREWHKCKVRFDAEKKLAEYFIDDMENPVFVNEEFLFNPKILPYFGIENYGLSRETVSYSLRNLKMTELSSEGSSSAEIRLEGTSLFKGISSSEWPLDQLVKKLGGGNVQVYVLETPGAHVDNGLNRFNLQPKPPRSVSILPENIILADIPLSAIPPYFQRQILQSVKAGGLLIILRGYFSLNKGNYSGSVLEAHLPVSVRDKWRDPEVLPGAETVKQNGKTVMAIRKYGKGKIIAALEMPHLENAGACLLEYDYGKGI